MGRGSLIGGCLIRGLLKTFLEIYTILNHSKSLFNEHSQSTARSSSMPYVISFFVENISNVVQPRQDVTRTNEKLISPISNRICPSLNLA